MRLTTGVKDSNIRIKFLAFESPWPAHSGCQKRVYELLRELSQDFTIDLILLNRRLLSDEQKGELAKYVKTLNQIARCDVSFGDKLKVAFKAVVLGLPYHTALIQYSYAEAGISIPQATERVFSNAVHWAIPLQDHMQSRWIVDQQNADVQYWRVYTKDARNPLIKFIALLNGWATYRYCQKIYHSAARVISVCEEDRQLSQQVAPAARIEVIPNGVDCDFFHPQRNFPIQPRILFTGTSADRNMKALRFFTHEVYPIVRKEVPQVELVIGGIFSASAQAEFAVFPGVYFTGPLPDLRPLYNDSALFICPFEDTYGSKLKVSEALAMGICVVSTPAGVRGFPLVDGESVLIGRDRVSLARQVIRALSEPALTERIGSAGRSVAEQHLDWHRVLGPRLRQIARQAYEGTK